MTPVRRARRAVCLVLTVLLASLATVGLVVPAQADGWVPITGSGSTWSQNALDQWRRNVAANYGMTVNYSGTGSTQGRLDFIAGTVDFAISEIPFQANPEDLSAPEVPSTKYAYMPIVAGGTSIMYNLKIGGKRVTNLRFSGDTLTKIFTGVITKWNDPAIQADNPSLAMPDKNIVPVVRSDGSGTSAQFTLWMSSQYPDLWQAFCAKVNRANACGMTSQYPVFGSAKAQKGSDGVSGYVSQSYGEGAITYVEYSYARKAGFPVAKLLNAAGYYVEPTAQAVAVALLQATIKSDLTQDLSKVYTDTDKRVYPMSSYSYMIVPTEVKGIFTAARASRRATLVCVNAPGLIRMNAVPSSRAACTRSTSSCSALDWNEASSEPDARAFAASSAAMSASVAWPYTSGSRVPSRLRLGPCRTRILAKREIRRPAPSRSRRESVQELGGDVQKDICKSPKLAAV